MMQLYWVALKSIWTKEIHRFMRIWVQTLVPPVITMTLYLSLIHISEPTRPVCSSRMPSSA